MSANFNLVLSTTRVSILIQFITGILGLFGLTVPVKESDMILKEILTLEMIVQGIEFLFYLVLVYLAHIHTMTLFRYGDWFLSTPTMLFTMISYYLHSSPEPVSTVKEVWDTHKEDIIIIFLANFGMLAFGLAGELGFISKLSGFVLGTLCFLISFGKIYQDYAKDSKARPLYMVMTVIWSFYGVAYLQSAHNKNISYNALDILAKNFFGIYLAYILWAKYQEEQKV